MPISYDLPQVEEPGSKVGGRPPGAGPGVGPGGGFGGAFGGGGSGFFGANPAIVGATAFGGQGPKRKVVQGPNGPISVAYSPMVADNVPAMLSPGEGVLNNGVMAQPGMAEWLQAANRMGAQRMAEGGVVPLPGGGKDAMGGMGMGGSDPDMLREILLKLLPILLGIPEDGAEDQQEGPDGMACGGIVKPQHMAGGGVARGVPAVNPADVLQWLKMVSAAMNNRSPFQDSWSGTPVDGGLVFPGTTPVDPGMTVTPQGASVGADFSHSLYGTSRPAMMLNTPVQGFAFGGMAQPKFGPQAGLSNSQTMQSYGGFQRPQQMAPTAPRMPSGGVGSVGMSLRPGAMPGGFQNPGGVPGRGPTGVGAPQPGAVGVGTGGSPWGTTPWAPGSPNPGDEWKNRLEGLLSQYGQAGFFDPGGNSDLMQRVQAQALNTANAQNMQAQNQSKLFGLDPGQAGSFNAEAALRGQGNVADATNNAMLQQLMSQQQFGQGLLGKTYDANTQAWLQRLASWQQGGA